MAISAIFLHIIYTYSLSLRLPSSLPQCISREVAYQEAVKRTVSHPRRTSQEKGESESLTSTCQAAQFSAVFGGPVVLVR